MYALNVTTVIFFKDLWLEHKSWSTLSPEFLEEYTHIYHREHYGISKELAIFDSLFMFIHLTN